MLSFMPYFSTFQTVIENSFFRKHKNVLTFQIVYDSYLYDNWILSGIWTTKLCFLIIFSITHQKTIKKQPLFCENESRKNSSELWNQISTQHKRITVEEIDKLEVILSQNICIFHKNCLYTISYTTIWRTKICRLNFKQFKSAFDNHRQL